MHRTVTLALGLALAACGGADEDGDDGDLTGSTGTIDGSLAYGDDETLTFASGVAFGDSFFHDDHDVIVLTAWGDASCDSTDSFDWRSSGVGYRLEVAHDDGTVVDEEVTLWDCKDDGSCNGVEFPTIVLDLDSYERERGGSVSGTVTVNEADDFLSGTLDIEVTYCGEW